MFSPAELSRVPRTTLLVEPIGTERPSSKRLNSVFTSAMLIEYSSTGWHDKARVRSAAASGMKSLCDNIVLILFVCYTR